MDLLQFEHKILQLSEKEISKIEKKILRRIGTVFLKAIRKEIKRLGLVQSKETMKSFTKGKRGNIFRFDKNRNTFTLEVGSSYYIARFLNDGYVIKTKHFVPGRMEGSKFIYDPNATTTINGKEQPTGIMMHPRSFIGRNYLDLTIVGIEGGLVELIEDLLQKELDKVMAR
ncbi:HK97 gp10 family phage protein [Brevibacillus halotolerans]|uniref:HK97 gp10 family phage protein n=1 Tax=Brevibacillus halotolerans TaxID=1507437 RepID=UPI0015EFB516|nr:HK97 gp10 family phage protein [Brevibacillus halotolerans]MBA4534415.1 HK97 gp10 family phage protein [Brevibacillus halotolerans]